MRGAAADDDLVFSRTPCDRGDPAQAPQYLVVAPLDELGRLGEQRGEYVGLADSGQGEEDRGVALLARLSGVRFLGAGQGVDQTGDLPLGVRKLALHQVQAFGGAAYVSDSGCGRSRRNGDRRRP